MSQLPVASAAFRASVISAFRARSIVMAEITGLVISTVALASLFSPCVQLFEAFEVHHTSIRDYHNVTTKVRLLRQRFTGCGAKLRLDEAVSTAVEKSTGLKRRTYSCVVYAKSGSLSTTQPSSARSIVPRHPRAPPPMGGIPYHPQCLQ